MNKKEMIENMVEKTWISAKDSNSALQAFLDVVSEQMQNMEDQISSQKSDKQ